MRDLGVLIPILGICCGLLAIIGGVFVKPWLKLRERELQLRERDPAGGDEDRRRLREEVKNLRERLAVIERITVEKENSLAREIEDLRDEPRR
jgi:hypothetical protein